MIVPVLFFSFWPVFISFLVLEAMVGMFNSCGATLRSRHYPEHLQSTIMSLFRLPLNLLVVGGTLMTSLANDESDLKTVFAIIATVHAAATVLQVIVVRSLSNSEDLKKKL
jgi:hypothetical protein